MSLLDLLSTAFRQAENAWVYLPARRPWSLQSTAAVLESDEVPPDSEDDPDAGVPQIALDAGLKQVIDVPSLQSIIANASDQLGQPTASQLFEAFLFYCENDAFIVFDASLN